jgi:hypothetical protein
LTEIRRAGKVYLLAGLMARCHKKGGNMVRFTDSPETRLEVPSSASYTFTLPPPNKFTRNYRLLNSVFTLLPCTYPHNLLNNSVFPAGKTEPPLDSGVFVVSLTGYRRELPAWGQNIYTNNAKEETAE